MRDSRKSGYKVRWKIGGTYRQTVKQELSGNQNHRCAVCGSGVDPYSTEPADMATIEHIVPRSFGGSNERKNLVITCFKCNNCEAVQRQLFSDIYAKYKAGIVGIRALINIRERVANGE